MKQQRFEFRYWGGRRKGAGRPRKDGRAEAGVAHLVRPALTPRLPVHVTWRMERGVWNLRSKRSFSRLATAMWRGSDRFGFRLVHYAVMGDHVHLIVEANDRRALGRGMKGLGVRIARSLNRMMERQGRVLADRYHAHILRTPTEVKHARAYLLTNAQKHYRVEYPDPFASTTPLTPPQSWLLKSTLLRPQMVVSHTTR